MIYWMSTGIDIKTSDVILGQDGTAQIIIRTRIEKFLTSNSLNQFVTDTLIKPFPHSDHDCVYLTLNFEQVNRGPSYWHLNNDLLSDAALSPRSMISGRPGKPSTMISTISCYGGTEGNINLKSSRSAMQNC